MASVAGVDKSSYRGVGEHRVFRVAAPLRHEASKADTPFEGVSSWLFACAVPAKHRPRDHVAINIWKPKLYVIVKETEMPALERLAGQQLSVVWNKIVLTGQSRARHAALVNQSYSIERRSVKRKMATLK